MRSRLGPVVILLVGGSSAANGQTQAWDAAFAVLGNWRSNVTLTDPPNAGVSARASAALGYTRETERSQFGAGIDGGTYFDSAATPGTSQNIRFSYTGRLEWAYKTSPRGSLSVTDSLASTYSEGAPQLIDEGLVYPWTYSRFNRAIVTYTERLSPRTTLSVDAFHDYVSFPDDPTLIGGYTVGSGVRLSRQLGPMDDVSVRYTYRYSSFAAEGDNIHDVTLGWNRILNKTLAVSLTGGASYLDSASTPTANSWRAVGSAGLRGRWEHTNLTFFYSRRISQAYGYAYNRVADTFGVTLGRQMGRRLGASLRAVVSLSNDLSLPNTNYLSQSYLLGLSHRTTRQLSLSGGYGYTYSNQQALAAYGSHNFYLNARYGWQWR